MNIREQLLKEFRADELEWRVKSCGIRNNKPWVMALVYLNARAIQDRLDEVFGWENWTDEYRELSGNIICRLGVYTNGKWIYKENGSSPTDIEAFKGGISGAFKRAASSGYGIGRYLYSVESNFAECSLEKKQEYTEKAKTKDGKIIYWKIPAIKIKTEYIIDSKELEKLYTLQKEASVTDEKLKEYLVNTFGIYSVEKLNLMQFEMVCKLLTTKISRKKKAV